MSRQTTIPRGPIAETLEKALWLIGDEKCWTQGASATDDLGDYVSPSSPYAVHWCVAGAIAAFTDRYGAAISLLDDFAEGHSGQRTNIIEVNDTSTHAAVISILVDALEHAEQEGL